MQQRARSGTTMHQDGLHSVARRACNELDRKRRLVVEAHPSVPPIRIVAAFHETRGLRGARAVVVASHADDEMLQAVRGASTGPQSAESDVGMEVRPGTRSGGCASSSGSTCACNRLATAVSSEKSLAAYMGR